MIHNHFVGEGGGVGVKPNYYNWLQYIEVGGGGEVLHYYCGGIWLVSDE